MSTTSNKSFTAFIGIDWADAKHDVCTQVAGEEQREFCCIEHKVEAIDDWAQGSVPVNPYLLCVVILETILLILFDAFIL